MDQVDRMYRHLVRTIRTSFPPYLSRPFEVGELYQTVLPYRLHRRELGLETNQDYEMALLELLTGARGYLVVDDKMRDVLSKELASPTPDTTRIREFGSSHVALAPEALSQLEGVQRPSSAVSNSGESGTVPRMSAATRVASGGSPTVPVSVPDRAAADARAARPILVGHDENCPFCKGVLPAGRTISFCPHCGQNLTVVHCPACGSELERGWKFCVTCGRAAEKSVSG